MPEFLRAFVALLVALVRGSVVKVHFGSHDAWLHPRTMRIRPSAAGGAEGDDEDDEDDDDEDDPPKPPESKDDDEDDDKPPEEWDPERAARTIRKQRQKESEARKRAEAAEARVRELEQASESEQQRIVRERDEAKAEAERAIGTARRLLVNEAIRDACSDADIPAKKVKRVLKLIDRDEITVDADGEVTGVDVALEELLTDLPELKATPAPVADDEDDPPRREPPGGKPDRKRKPKELTSAEVSRMAKEDPARFNELFDAGKIPASALR